MAYKEANNLSFAKVIFDEEDIHVCEVCYEEENLKKLPCGHLECKTCIGKC